MEVKKTQRNSAIELLRILAIIMIIFHHITSHGDFNFDESTIEIPRLWFGFIKMGGKIGVNIFALISGYFLVSDSGKLFDLKRTLQLVGQTLFYSVTISLVAQLIGYEEFSVTEIVKSFFPLTRNIWWYASCYVVLFLLHPFINKLLNLMDKKTYQKFLILLVALQSVLPTIFMYPLALSDFGWLLVLYIIAGYIKLFGLNPKISSKKYAVSSCVLTLLTIGCTFLIMLLGMRWSVFADHWTYLFVMNRVPALLISVTLFMAFVKMKPFCCKWINVIASAMFGVYLLHNHPIIRDYLWNVLFKLPDYQDSLLLIPYSIGAVAIVFIATTLIDLARKYTIEKGYMFLVNRYADKVFEPLKRFVYKIGSLVFGKD